MITIEKITEIVAKTANNDYIDIRANQPLESELYFNAKDNLRKYLLDTNGISQSVIFTPHEVPVC